MKKKKATENEWRMKYVDNWDCCWWSLASLFLTVMLGVIAASCDVAPSCMPMEPEEGLPATIRLNVMPDAVTPAQTRVEESVIKDLHVLVYNSNGELIGKNYTASSTLTVNTRSGSGYTLYAIANTGNADLFKGTVADTEMKLKAMKTSELSTWDELTTASHLVMVGSKTDVSINAGNSTLQGDFFVSRIVAKVTLNISIKSGSGITIKDYQVFSLPTESFYMPNTTDVATTWIDGEKIAVNATSVNEEFFMYENRRGIESTITNQKDKGTENAPDKSTYVVINGEASGYKAIWWIYLGENNSSDFNMKRNSQYSYNITLNRPGTDGADTRVEVEDTFITVVGGNSNCYMVKPGSAVTIPVERANESPIELTGSFFNAGTYYQLETTTAWTASLVWESSKNLIKLSEIMGTGPSGRFKVTAANAYTQGNAVVAIKNASDEILWSWHIWVTTYDGTNTFTNDNGKRIFTFMDRELGASSTVRGEVGSCGLMYQWGRKDPFPGIGQEGGSWVIANASDPIRVYNASGNTYEITKKSVPNVTPNNLTNAIRNPDTFYSYATAPYDWFVYNGSSTQNNDLWSGGNIAQTTATKKSVFDPCPDGWRIPPFLDGISPFTKMEYGSAWGDYGRIWGSSIGGYFPASGFRSSDSGGIYSVASDGYRWSGSTIGTYGYYLNFSSSAVTPTYNLHRAYGFPLRCCQDNL